MSNELIIKNGLTLDGTDREPFPGNDEVNNRSISKLGHVQGKVNRKIDADLNYVTTSFIDLHAHFYAQAG